MKKKLAFLHTLDANVSAFEDLVRASGSDCVVAHRVDESVLKDVFVKGAMDEGIEERIRTDLSELVDDGADLVVCTCSSIGAVAEAMNASSTVEIQRIDRAMADEAVRVGDRIVLAASLSSTLGPTRELLESSASRLAKSISVKEVVIADAWKYFEAGDRSGYVEAIAKGLEAEIASGDVIVLAQASMADAARLVSDCPIPILSSPGLGVDRALAALG